MVVKARIDVMWEVVQEDRSDSHGSMVWKGIAPLRRGGCGSIHERALSAENGDISCNRGGSVHRGLGGFVSRGGDENIVGVNGDVFVKRCEEEGVEDFLGYLGGSGRHR